MIEKIKTLRFKYTNYLGFSTELKHTPKQIKELNKMNRNELTKKFQAICDDYSTRNVYWTEYILNDKVVASQYPADM